MAEAKHIVDPHAQLAHKMTSRFFRGKKKVSIALFFVAVTKIFSTKTPISAFTQMLS